VPAAAGPKLSDAVQRAYARRAARKCHIEWFIDNVANKLAMDMRTRVKVATELAMTSVVRNISRPVTKTRMKRKRDTTRFKGGGPKGSSYTKVTDRSKAGEFPKADTTQLRKSIFRDLKQIAKGNYEGYVGTPLDYGLVLEMRMDRSFLLKTLGEIRSRVMRMLSGPVK
jgi:hypothetical protein